MKRPGGFDRGFPADPFEPDAVGSEPLDPASLDSRTVEWEPKRNDARSDDSEPVGSGRNEREPTGAEPREPGPGPRADASLAPVTQLDTVDLSRTADLSGVAAPEDAVARPGAVDLSLGGSEPGSEPTRRADVRGALRRLRQASRSRRTREKREQRRFTAHLRRRRRYWITGAAAVLGLAAFVAVGVFTPVMAVREVRVEGAQQIDVAAVQDAMKKFEGVPLALVDDREVHTALQSFTLIERYSLERIPPQTLVLRVEERDPVIALERDGGFGLYDAAGVFISVQPEAPDGVPVGAGAVLDPGTSAFRAAGQIVRDLPEDLRSALTGVEAASAQQVTLVLNTGTRVVWGNHDLTQRKAVVLRAMIARLGAVSSIDVSAPDTPVFTP